MKNKFLFTVLLTTLCLLIFIAKNFAQNNKSESYKVNKGGTLKIESSGGDIKVKIWDKNEVMVLFDDEDDDYNGTIIKQSKDDVTIISQDYVDFEISIPSEYNLKLNTSGGDIDVLNNVKGKVSINTSGGDIQIKDVMGEVSVATSGGDIFCGNIKGNAKLTSSGGDIVAGNVDGECNLSTGGGNIQVNDVSKTLVVATGGGNIQSGNVSNNVTVVTGGGNISLSKISGDMVITTGGGNVYGVGSKSGKVVTGSGDISLKDLKGGVKITSGAGNVKAEFSSVGKDESKITTGYGNIAVYIPENEKVTIEAVVKFSGEKGWVNEKQEISDYIKSDFKVSTEDRRNDELRAVYQVNGGGTKIYLQASIGNIEIRKAR